MKGSEAAVDFWGTILVLVRRWYVVLPVFLMSGGGAAALYMTLPPHYSSTAVVVLTTPTNGGTVSENGTPSITNPLIYVAQGLPTASSIVSQELSAPEVAAQVGLVAGRGTTYTVGDGSTSPEMLLNTPFLIIRSEGPDQQLAHDVVVRLVDQARLVLARQQQSIGAPPTTFIGIEVLVPPTRPQILNKSRSRAAVAAIGLGIIITLFAAFSAESIADRRKGHRIGSEGLVDGLGVPRTNGGSAASSQFPNPSRERGRV